MFVGFKFHLRTKGQQLDEEPVHKICGLCVCFNLPLIALLHQVLMPFNSVTVQSVKGRTSAPRVLARSLSLCRCF